MAFGNQKSGKFRNKIIKLVSNEMEEEMRHIP